MPTILQQVDSDFDAGFDPDPVPVALKVIYHDPVLFVAFGSLQAGVDDPPGALGTIGYGHRVPVSNAAGGVMWGNGSFFGQDDSTATEIGLYAVSGFRHGTAAPPLEQLSVSLPDACHVLYSYVYPRDKLVAIIAIDGPSGEMGSISIPSGSGTGTVSGLTDEPSLLITRSADAQDFGNPQGIGFGACDHDLNQWAASVCGGSFTGTYLAVRHRQFLDTVAWLQLLNSGSDSVTVEVTAINADGFDYSYVNTTGSSFTVKFTAWYIPSGETKVGVGEQGDSVSTGFAPEGVVYGSVQTDDLSVQSGVYVSVGGGAKKGGQRVAWTGVGVLDGDGHRRFDTGVIRFSEDDGTTLIDLATQVLGPTGATLTWDSGSGGRKFGWYAWGETNSDPVPCPRGEKIIRYV